MYIYIDVKRVGLTMTFEIFICINLIHIFMYIYTIHIFVDIHIIMHIYMYIYTIYIHT